MDLRFVFAARPQNSQYFPFWIFVLLLRPLGNSHYHFVVMLGPSDTLEAYKYSQLRLFAVGRYNSISSRNLSSPYRPFPFPLDNFYYLPFSSTIFGLTICLDPHTIAVKRIVQIFCFYANVLFYF